VKWERKLVFFPLGKASPPKIFRSLGLKREKAIE
jgi:hypothetical protein